MRITGDIPVGLGMGSSSSDVVAVVRAVADSYGTRLPPETIARLAVRAELACDPLMLDGRPVLFAQREGRVLEVLGRGLPPVVVVGCALGAGAPVDTLSLPVRAHDDGDVRACERLRVLLRQAVTTGDVALLGEVATASARRGQEVLCHPEFESLTDVAARFGVSGRPDRAQRRRRRRALRPGRPRPPAPDQQLRTGPGTPGDSHHPRLLHPHHPPREQGVPQWTSTSPSRSADPT